MTANVTITLDTLPPANPSLSINGGAVITGSTVVAADIVTADYQGGANDVAQMLVWGDVDPSGDVAIQPTQGASSWLPFTPAFPLLLSSAAGPKTIYAILQDLVGNETMVFSAVIIYDPTNPVVSISQGLDHGVISTMAPLNKGTFGWQSSLPFQAYKVAAVPNAGSPEPAGIPIPVTAGSVNIAGSVSPTTPFPAATTIVTQVMGADLLVASPGNGPKVVKVFVQSVGGAWSQ